MGAYISANLGIAKEYAQKAVKALEENELDDYEGKPEFSDDGSVSFYWDTENRSYDFTDDILGSLEKAGIPEEAYMLRTFCPDEDDAENVEQFFGRYHGPSACAPVISVRINGNPFAALAESLKDYYNDDKIAEWIGDFNSPKTKAGQKPGLK